jgi:hypothetical protein
MNQAVKILTSGASQEQLPPMNCFRSYHAAVFLESYIYVLGGNNQYGVSQPAFERFSCDHSVWQRLKDIPKPLYKASACQSKGILHFTDFSARSIFT